MWVARCANTGVSALIDPHGDIVAKSELFAPALIEGTIHFQQGGSLYTRTGDSVPLLLSLIVVIWLWQSRNPASVNTRRRIAQVIELPKRPKNRR